MNFVLTWLLAQQRGAGLALRIDDFDRTRCRDEYIEDVFKTLRWLGISWNEGPVSLSDFHQTYSQMHSQDLYWKRLEPLREQGLTFACECSRSQRDRFSSTGAYLGHCRDRGLRFAHGQHSLRLRTEGSAEWHATLKDFVLWTKEDLAAYQLVSLVEDLRLGVDFVVRGEDLRHSSEAQKYLATLLGEPSFLEVKFLHHALLQASGAERKLSKSAGAASMQSQIAAGLTLEGFLGEMEKFFPIHFPEKGPAYARMAHLPGDFAKF
jgi:glutamyl/glutaminyl-tRNA synthetase